MSKRFMSVKLHERQIEAIEKLADDKEMSRSAAIRYAICSVTGVDPEDEFTGI